MTLYLFKHSNYYNRILKRYDTINEYIQNSIQLGVYQNINFKPYDGVQTFQILNHQGETPDYIICVDDSLAIDSRWYVIEDERLLNGQYRYNLLRDVIADYYNDILTAPCFVEKALLKADDPLIFNPEQMSFNQIKKEEYYLKDKSQSPWIVAYIDKKYPAQNETVSVSGSLDQAFSSNIVDLNNNSYSSYLQYFTDEEDEFVSKKQTMSILQEYYNYEIDVPLEFTYKNSTSDKPYTTIRASYRNYIDDISDEVNWDTLYTIIDRDFDTIQEPFYLGSQCINNNALNSQEFINSIFKNMKNSLYNEDTARKNVINSAIASCLKSNLNSKDIGYVHNMSTVDINFFKDNQNKVFKYTDTNTDTDTEEVYYYTISITELDAVPDDSILNWRFRFNSSYPAPAFVAGSYTESAIKNSLSGSYIDSSNNQISYNSNSQLYPDKASQLSYNSIDLMSPYSDGLTIGLSKNNKVFSLKVTKFANQYNCSIFGADSRTRNESGVYDVFAIPYNDGFRIKKDANTFFENNQRIAMITAQAFATKANANIYDLQILPYCPCPEFIEFDDTGPYLDLTKIDQGSKSIVWSGRSDLEDSREVSALVWCSESKYSFNIDSPIDLTQINNPLDKKINIQTKFYRLCSPGYTSIYQFQPQFNNGINIFNVQIVFQPFNPFIRVAPQFNNGSLYGMYSQYDSKGLILKGDFQIPILNSAWEAYQVNNKNYSEIYDREVQNLELTQSIERKMQVLNAITGTISGTVSGATTGAVAGGGNPIAAAAGAAVGGASSAIGGVLDVKYGDMLREEALDYKNDMFRMQLDNIKALPSSLTKSSPISDNNPIWPILEVYDCTDVEKNALKDKIKYNGMTVGIIGTINKYLNNKQYYSDYFNYMYFKGRLIRLDSIYADSHIVNAISNELNRGIYL